MSLETGKNIAKRKSIAIFALWVKYLDADEVGVGDVVT